MRTTLTLDEDVAAKLKDFVRRKQVSFKEAVNSLLRRGLSATQPRKDARKPFRVDVFNSPFRPGVDPLRLNQLSDDLEVEAATTPRKR
jgi:hypothetical protein